MKILIIRFSSIGDIVLTTPVIRCLKKQLKGVEIHYLTKKAFQPIITNNPYIDKAFYLENDLKPILYELKQERYDYVIDLHSNLRTFLVKSYLYFVGGVKAAKIWKFDKLNFEKWLLVKLKVNRLPQTHIVDRYLHTVKALGVSNDGLGLDYVIPAADEVDLETIPVTKNGYIAFAIGAQHATKRLPTAKIISICRQIQQPIVLLGGNADKAVGEEVVNALGEKVYNACGKYNLNQSASLLRQSTAVITHDTGLMHIAAAFNKKIVSVWGNTIPAFGMTPYFSNNQVTNGSVIVEVTALSCRPCSKIGYNTCPKQHFKCMNLIDEAFIVQALSHPA